VQRSSKIITTNKPTPNLFTGRMPFLSPNQKCQDIEGNGVLNLTKVEDKSSSTLKLLKNY